PRSPVHDLVVKGDDLVVATHGRSFWILGDVAPLREVSAAAHASAAYLYTPETGYRLYYPDQVDDRPPSGQNPPAGALIDYYLPSRPTGTVSLDILDAAGSVVRHLTSVKPQGAEQPPEWPDQVHPVDTLPASEGMNRFEWNLRYDDPTQIPGALKSEVATALKEANGKASAAALTAEGGALIKQAAQIEGLLMQVNIKGSEANLNFPGMLNEQIYSFSGLLDDADTAPNAQEIETYAGLHAQLAAQLAAWSALGKSGVASFRAHAQGAGQRAGATSTAR